MSELVKELIKLGLIAKFQGDTTDGPVVKTVAPVVGKPPQPSPTTSTVNVEKWILENKLEKFPYLKSLQPAHLQFLKMLSLKAKDFYYALMMDLIREKASVDDLNALMEVTDAVNKVSA